MSEDSGGWAACFTSRERPNLREVMNVAATPTPPLHLVLGSDALGLAEKKVDGYRQVLAEHRAISVSTDFAA